MGDLAQLQECPAGSKSAIYHSPALGGLSRVAMNKLSSGNFTVLIISTQSRLEHSWQHRQRSQPPCDVAKSDVQGSGLLVLCSPPFAVRVSASPRRAPKTHLSTRQDAVTSAEHLLSTPVRAFRLLLGLIVFWSADKNWHATWV